jgi:hypothetical protein
LRTHDTVAGMRTSAGRYFGFYTPVDALP